MGGNEDAHVTSCCYHVWGYHDCGGSLLGLSGDAMEDKGTWKGGSNHNRHGIEGLWCSYRTLKEATQVTELIIKKSRFLARAWPIEDAMQVGWAVRWQS